jgi:hypothetical protein
MKKPALIPALIICTLSIVAFVLFSESVSPPSDSVSEPIQLSEEENESSLNFETYLTSDGKGIVITGYMGEGGDVHIPATLDGLPVRIIGLRSFSENITITSVTIPEGVMWIVAFAFSDCSNLTTVTLPASIETIDAHSFSGCSALVSVYIPDSVAEINFPSMYWAASFFENNAFMGCNSLSSETKERLRKLGYTGPFLAFPKQRNQDFEYRLVAEGEEVEITEYIGKAADVVIPDTLQGKPVTRIGEYAFINRALISVTLPAMLKEIGVLSFEGCSNLIHVYIPDSVRSIYFPSGYEVGGNYAFTSSKNLSPESQAALKARGWRGFDY